MALLPTTISAQVLPGGLPRLPGSGLLGQPLDRVTSNVQPLGNTLLQAPSRLTGLIRRSKGALEADPYGWPVVSGEIIAIGLSDTERAEAERLGYGLIRQEELPELGLSVLILSPPRGQRLALAVERLADIAPDADVDFNHVHGPAGELSAEVELRPVVKAQSRRVASLGLIDTGVALHPSLANSSITQQGFAGTVRPAAHGTAVASLMVGQASAFSGAAPGADLKVADIYGDSATGGSSTALARALAWMAGQGVAVVNISLVGPRNPVVARAVTAAQARGVTLVAAAGNDGPAAPPLYPAAYSGVVGVAAVNGRQRPLPETGRGPHVDFAAPGADMAAAGQGGGYVTVRGSSFAAPLVAGLIARHGLGGVTRQAIDLGQRGRDDAYGQGLVGAELAVAPRTAAARGSLRQ